MKNRLGKLSLLLIICLTLIIINGCNKKEENKNEEIKYESNFISSEAYSESYEDIDGSLITITKNDDENNSLKLDISIFRLAHFESDDAKETKDGIEFKTLDPNGNEASGLIYKDGDNINLKFTDCNWIYIKTDDEFKEFKFKEKRLVINPQTKDNFIDKENYFIIKDINSDVEYKLDDNTKIDENVPCYEASKTALEWVKYYLENSMDNENAVESGFGMGDMIAISCDNDNNIIRVDSISWWD